MNKMAKNELMRSLLKSLDAPVEAKVHGNLPEWVSGTLFRNGPGRFEYDDKFYEHLFDGQACVHKFEIKNGKVFYFNKLLETKSLSKTINDKRLYPLMSPADVSSTLFGRLKTFFNPTNDIMDNTNVNIVPFAHQQLYALTETHYVMKIDPKTLDITKRLSVAKCIPSSKTIIAHPHTEADGSWIDMGMNTSVPGYEFVRYDGTGLKDPSLDNILQNGKVINCIPSSHSYTMSYFHSFGLSQNYIIFLEQALKLSFLSYASSFVLNKSYGDCMYMDPTWNTKIHLINRKTGEIVAKKFHTDPLFVFHHINAYEKEIDGKTEIVVDICAYDANHFDIKKLKYQDMFTDRLMGQPGFKPMARRIIVPLDLSSVNSESVYCKIKDLNSNLSLELPNINYSKLNTLPYKYVYGANIYQNPLSIVKINVENDAEQWEFKFEKGEIPTEPVFIENPNPQSEDDGVLLVMCLATDNDYLLILDSKDLTEIARAVLPDEAKGSFTFHGFFADAVVDKALN